MWFHCLYISKVIRWQETVVSCIIFWWLANIVRYHKIDAFMEDCFLCPWFDLNDGLNGKMFHTFVRCEFVTLWRLVLVKSDYVVRGVPLQLHIPCAYFTHAATFLFFSFADMIKVKRILIRITKLVLSRKMIFF